MLNPYDVLGVPRGASIEESHAAMKRLAQMYHPDRYEMASPEVRAEAERRMKDVNAAYDSIRSGAASSSDESEETQATSAYQQAVREAVSYSGQACDLCGHAPTAQMTFRYGIGMLLVRKVQGFQGELCADCGTALFRDAQNQTLVKGWWGLISFFANFAYIAGNLSNVGKANRLMRPRPTPRVVLAPLSRPLDRGKHLVQRGGIWVAGFALLLAASIGVGAYQDSQQQSSSASASSGSVYGQSGSPNTYYPPTASTSRDCAYTIGDTVYRVSCTSGMADYEIADEVFSESSCPYDTEFYTEEGSTVICWTRK